MAGMNDWMFVLTIHCMVYKNYNYKVWTCTLQSERQRTLCITCNRNICLLWKTQALDRTVNAYGTMRFYRSFIFSVWTRDTFFSPWNVIVYEQNWIANALILSSEYILYMKAFYLIDFVIIIFPKAIFNLNRTFPLISNNPSLNTFFPVSFFLIRWNCNNRIFAAKCDLVKPFNVPCCS